MKVSLCWKQSLVRLLEVQSFCDRDGAKPSTIENELRNFSGEKSEVCSSREYNSYVHTRLLFGILNKK